MSKYTINEIKELMAMGFTPEQIARMCEDTPVKGKGKKPTGAKATPELVEFVKNDGTKVMCTPKQAEAWSKWRSHGKPLDEVKAEWNAKHDAYVPSKELIEAIKLDRAKVTHKVAKAEYGFVGTKDELRALKVKVLAK